MAAFGASWGYGAWLYIPEIMPLRVRGKAVGLCTFVNWGPANNVSAMLTPWMLKPDVFGAGGTLLFFGCVAAFFVPFAYLCLPETKGQSLESILPMFAFKVRRNRSACTFCLPCQSCLSKQLVVGGVNCNQRRVVVAYDLLSGATAATVTAFAT
jgi:hypothetical protein